MQTIHSLGVYVFTFPSLLKCVTTALWSGGMGPCPRSGGKARVHSGLLLEGAGPAGTPQIKTYPTMCVSLFETPRPHLTGRVGVEHIQGRDFWSAGLGLQWFSTFLMLSVIL